MWKTGSYTHCEIGEQVGGHHLSVGRWIKKYQAGGSQALHARLRGRQEGSGRCLTPRQETLIQLNAKRESVNLISALTNQGKVRFRFFDGRMNADVLLDFMTRLIRDTQRKDFLILDNLRVHHARNVKKWLAEHKSEIEVFYLPTYSPELNPDEYLNCDLKAGVHSGQSARSKRALKAKAINHLRKLQKLPGRVMKHFEAEFIEYAA